MKIISVFLSFLTALSALCAGSSEQAAVKDEVFGVECQLLIAPDYARDGIVISDGCGGFLIEDTTENLWEYQSQKLVEGQRVVLLMSDNDTPTIYDDEILSVLPLAVAVYSDFDNLHLTGEARG